MKERVVTRAGHTFTVVDDHPQWPDGHPNNVDFWGLYGTGVWEPALDDILRRYLTPRRTFVDVGAWIGPVTLLASRLAEHVFAVEPDPAAVVGFQANMRASSVRNVTLCRCAIGPGTSTVTIGQTPGGAWGDSMTSVNHLDGDILTVPAYSLRGLFEAYDITHCGLIKLDVEGAEAEILAQARDFLAELRVPLLVSLHQPLRPDPDRYATILGSALEEFRVEFVDGDWDTLATVLVTP